MKVGTFAKDFEDWRNTTVTISPFTSYDKFGTPSYGSAVSTLCYLEMHPKMITNDVGQQVVSQSRLYIVGSSAYTARDKVVLPDSKYPPILKIDNYYNEIGTLEMSVINL
jgi:hypothetical protein